MKVEVCPYVSISESALLPGVACLKKIKIVHRICLSNIVPDWHVSKRPQTDLRRSRSQTSTHSFCPILFVGRLRRTGAGASSISDLAPVWSLVAGGVPATHGAVHTKPAHTYKVLIYCVSD